MKDGNILKYSHKFNSSIYCDVEGQHKILDKCPKNNENIILASDKLSNDDSFNYFNDDNHLELMKDLNKKIKLNFKI